MISPRKTRKVRPRLFLLGALLLLLAVACGSTPAAPPPSLPPLPTATPDPYNVGRPQERAGLGDAERALARFGATQQELIRLFQAQDWYRDGLTPEEALFVERSLNFSASIVDPRFRGLDPRTIEQRLFLHERVQTRKGEVEILLIYEPEHDAERQMALLAAALPVLVDVVDVQFPERVLTFVNGTYGINDYNEGGLIRIDRCCTLSAFVLIHEMAHAYWSRGPSWFNEGMADVYAIMVLELLADRPPSGWARFDANLEAFHASRRESVARAGFPDLPLARRFATDGLYQVADLFLLDLRQMIGAEAFRTAARDIYLASDFGRFRLSEKRVQDVFLAYTPDQERERVMQHFNRHVWGDDGERYRSLVEFEDGD